jgi:FMN phosphatase YigB (HAD superfamily)
MTRKINWSDAVFFFDVDDTLIETAKNSIIASQGIFNTLKKELGKEKAKSVTERFRYIFNTLANQHWANQDQDHSEYDSIIDEINKFQKPVVEKYGNIRKWSREVFLKIASDDLSIHLNPELIYESINNYWEMVSDNSTPIEGVLNLFKKIKSHNRPIYFVTGSDARLKMNSQELFDYDPKYSEQFKAKRINALKNKGLFFNALSIGDPEDKPHLDFFEKAVTIAEKDLGHKLDYKNSIMFGDSYVADLQIPREKMNFGLVVLFKKGQEKPIEEAESYISLGNIYSVTDYLI